MREIGIIKTRAEAYALLTRHTKTESLLRHNLAVEAALRWYARSLGEDEELWGMTGLLHDFDYEENPELSEYGHPFVGSRILRREGYPESLIEAILGHAEYSGVERKSRMAKVLFAADDLTGLIAAAVLVRPDRSIHSLTLKSVVKKIKDKSFARAIDRDHIRRATSELGIELDRHIENVLAGMREAAGELGLAGK